jgi:lysophospholipase L1-like esterase
MTKRIAFSELVAKIQSGQLTQTEAAAYFSVDVARARRLSPGFALNEANVDLTGIEDAARAAANELAIAAGKVASASHFRSFRGVPTDGSIIAEGDSWFNLPDFYQKTMIDWLEETYPINNIANPGDTLKEIVLAGAYLPYLVTGKVRVLMFSAGGNDFLGPDVLPTCLNMYDVDHTDPRQAAYYLTGDFYRIIDECDQLYRQLWRQVQSISPQTQIVVHGYDYVNPWCNGIFLGKTMQVWRGLDPCWDPALCQAIVHLMIDRFNEMLANLDVVLPNFTYENLRGTLKPGDFFDEIHPTSAAAQLLANRMTRHLPIISAALAVAAAKRRGGRRPASLRRGKRGMGAAA